MQTSKNHRCVVIDCINPSLHAALPRAFCEGKVLAKRNKKEVLLENVGGGKRGPQHAEVGLGIKLPLDSPEEGLHGCLAKGTLAVY